MCLVYQQLSVLWVCSHTRDQHTTRHTPFQSSHCNSGVGDLSCDFKIVYTFYYYTYLYFKTISIYYSSRYPLLYISLNIDLNCTMTLFYFSCKNIYISPNCTRNNVLWQLLWIIVDSSLPFSERRGCVYGQRQRVSIRHQPRRPFYHLLWDNLQERWPCYLLSFSCWSHLEPKTYQVNTFLSFNRERAFCVNEDVNAT